MKRIASFTILLGLAWICAAAQTAMPADAAAGERFFGGKGNCASCHMVRGRGGILGPDLSDIGHDRTSAQIEQALRDPDTFMATARPARRDGGVFSYPAVTVRLRTGQTIHGIAKNENAFELQVLDMDGK